ncbi:hypothetical protein [Burkholderia ubonensis]|uniref:hypothetical protein n=1 Tax=Burkholderia ubonensis TaxID=101571 RepID=UPI000A66B778|nr:hypothetical protein [Burkholderia ubonensis]
MSKEKQTQLAAPTILEAVDGVLNTETLKEGAHVVIPAYPNMFVGDKITLRWAGRTEFDESYVVHQGDVGHNVAILVSKHRISAPDPKVLVDYKVTTHSGNVAQSEKITLKVI